MEMSSTYLVSALQGAILTVTIAGQPTPARAASPSQWAYDPAKCVQDAAGRRYVAIGPTVVAIDPDPAFVAGAAIELDKSRRLTPPDPNDQLGCPDNPNQVLISFPLQAIFSNLPEVARALGIGLRGFGLVPMHGIGLGALNGKPIIPEQPSTYRDNPRSTDDLCNRPGASVTKDAGIETCRWPSDWREPGTAYVVDPAVYSTPAGDPFRVRCGLQAYDGRLTPCYVGTYATKTGLAIGYQFFPDVPIRTSDFIQRIITFDHQIRDCLNAAVISNYPWRTQP